MRISEHLTYEEAVKSNSAIRLGIKNIPDSKILDVMKITAEKIFEPIRKYFGIPITPSSFFRSIELNKKIGGSSSSQHCKGEAIDIDMGSKQMNIQLFDYVKKNMEFDQLINEFDFSWIHISYCKKNRSEILEAKKVKGKTIYTKIS